MWTRVSFNSEFTLCKQIINNCKIILMTSRLTSLPICRQGESVITFVTVEDPRKTVVHK